MPPFRWNAAARRYVDARGRFVSDAEVRKALEGALANAQWRGRNLSQQLRAGEVSLADWQQGMRRIIKQVHLYSAAVAAGGWAQMTYTDFGNLGPVIRFHYGRLQAFAQAIEAGYPLMGRFMSRVELYLLAGRGSYWMQAAKLAKGQGMTHERNVLHPADHCAECVTQTGLGWVPIGTLVPVGARTCLSRCKCTIEYSNLGARE